MEISKEVQPKPVKSTELLTRPMTQSLASQERSKKRELFEQIKREKELALREEQEKLESERIKKEEEEIKKIRA